MQNSSAHHTSNAGASQKFYVPKVVYDGKRMRKAVARRTIDFNSCLIKYLHERRWQKHPWELPTLYCAPNSILEYMPPHCYTQNAVAANVTMKFVHTSTNKVKCPINVVKWTPEGRRLITGSASGEFTLWNGLTFNFETIQQAHDSAIRAMAWNHAGSWMVSGDHSGFCKIWMPNMNNLKKIVAHKEPVRDISFSPNDTKFATCSDDGTIKIWDFAEAIEERALTGHGWDVKNCQWHPTKNLLASGSKDNLVKLWDAKSGANVATIHGHKNTVLDVKWNRNGNWLLTAGKDQVVRLFDIRSTRHEYATFKGHRKEIMSLAWHPHAESFFSSGGTDGSIFFWAVDGVPQSREERVGNSAPENAAPYGVLEAAHDAIVWSLDWHPVGHVLASGSNDNTSRFWTRSRPGDAFNDKFAIGRAAAEALGVRDVERGHAADDDDDGRRGPFGDREPDSRGPSLPFGGGSNEGQLPGLGGGSEAFAERRRNEQHSSSAHRPGNFAASRHGSRNDGGVESHGFRHSRPSSQHHSRR